LPGKLIHALNGITSISLTELMNKNISMFGL